MVGQRRSDLSNVTCTLCRAFIIQSTLIEHQSELENYDDDNDTGFENWNKEDGGNRGVDYQQMTKI